MDTILWAIAIPVGIIVVFLAICVSAIILIIIIPITLVVGGIAIGGPIGGVMVLLGALGGLAVYLFIKDNRGGYY